MQQDSGTAKAVPLNYFYRGVTVSKKQKTIVNHRSAVSGRFVTERYVKSHPATTVTEHNRISAPAKPLKRR
ncbi:hypothetical protein [Janthinobacterium lividum]|uniref:hypothetical protein n=1 Tax=Janthinobacterium lividum TaxID=29581 RepID=UPI001967ED96|nr:hypothetical protein [Janthinobacterium lividum]